MPCHILENAVWLLVHDCQTIQKIVNHESVIKMANNSGVHFMKRDVTKYLLAQNKPVEHTAKG
jgi:hypothetical protein